MLVRARKFDDFPFDFNLPKTIQAVAFLLKLKHKPANTDNYMRLFKLLYFADRESIKQTGSPITGDKFVALEHGPTLSRLVDFARQRRFDNIIWDEYIEKNGFEISLIKDPGQDKLSKYETDLLTKIWGENRELGEWDVAGKSEKLPEWIKNNPGSSSKSIPFGDVLEAIGQSECLKEIQQMAAENRAAKRFFKVA